MTAFVLDCSVTMGWCFSDESNPLSNSLLERLEKDEAVVPTLWALEVSNVLLQAERQKRISQEHAEKFLSLLQELPIQVIETSSSICFERILSLARQTKLSSYDAAYLALAVQEDLPLATLDRSLKSAARKYKVSLLSG